MSGKKQIGARKKTVDHGRGNRSAPSTKKPAEIDESPIGYGRPPAKNQFKPGTSGNPHGRPKRSRNLKTIIRSALISRVVLREGEKKRSVSKLEGIVLRQLESALKGNEKAALATLKMAGQVGLLDSGDAIDETPVLSAGEQEILNEVLAQSARRRKEKS